MEFLLDDLSATERLGAMIGAMLRPGDCILLDGPFGAGKTTLARALLRAAFDDPELEVPSPSYTLVQTYHAPAMTIHHLDLWRLGGSDELREVGWDEMRGDAMLVEWPDRLGTLRPMNVLTVVLAPAATGGHGARLVSVTGWPERSLRWPEGRPFQP